VIDEAIGKILGMAMAYAVSALGLWLAYVNYRRRVLGAERVMTPLAWGVVATVVALVAAAVWAVASLADPAAAAATAAVKQPSAVSAAPALPFGEALPWLGIVVPGAVFLVATAVTVALYRHFASRVR